MIVAAPEKQLHEGEDSDEGEDYVQEQINLDAQLAEDEDLLEDFYSEDDVPFEKRRKGDSTFDLQMALVEEQENEQLSAEYEMEEVSGDELLQNGGQEQRREPQDQAAVSQDLS